MNDKPIPSIAWRHIDLDVINPSEPTHLHIQEACAYRDLRLHFTLNTVTGERTTHYYLKGERYHNLNEAINAWKERKRKKRKRLNAT